MSIIINVIVLLLIIGAVGMGSLYFLISNRERHFTKYLIVGEVCRYYISEDEDVLCEILEINGDKLKIKNLATGEIYNTIKSNISTP